MSGRRIVLACIVLVAVGVAVWAAIGGGSTAVPAALRARLDIASDRMQKTDLIQQLRSAPAVVILGGSRALRFDPAYIKKRTGLTGFNAAVTGARPEDAWALVSLLHTRFPSARFRFLWIIHADEFDPKSLDPGLVYDATLAGFFPPALITPQIRAEAAHLHIDPMQQGRIFAPDGYVIHDGFNRLFPQRGVDAVGVRNNIVQALHVYAASQPKLSARSVLYFEKTLTLMESIAAAPPVIVSAPIDTRILAATVNHGWGARQRLLLKLIAGLRARYRFDFADLSNTASCGCTPADFFDGIHLRASGARKVVASVLHRFPGVFVRTAPRELVAPSPSET